MVGALSHRLSFLWNIKFQNTCSSSREGQLAKEKQTVSLSVVHQKQTLSKETAVELKEEVTKVGFSPGGGAYLYLLINFKCLLPIFHLTQSLFGTRDYFRRMQCYRQVMSPYQLCSSLDMWIWAFSLSSLAYQFLHFRVRSDRSFLRRMMRG